MGLTHFEINKIRMLMNYLLLYANIVFNTNLKMQNKYELVYVSHLFHKSTKCYVVFLTFEVLASSRETPYLIIKNLPMQYTEILSAVKIKNFIRKK